MDKEGTVHHRLHFTTSEGNLLSKFDSVKGKLKVHLESCELAGWARALLLEKVCRPIEVVVTHAKSNAWVAKDPLKNDGLDAWKLADLIRMGRTHEVFFSRDEDLLVFKRTVQHYQDLTEQQATLKTKIKARIRVEGIITSGKTTFSEDGRGLLLNNIENQFRREAFEQLYRMLDHPVAAQQEALELMKKQAGRFPIIERLKEVPGVGLKMACRFVGYIQNPHRFATKRKLWRYCRLGITDRNSDNKPLGYKRLDSNGVGALKDLSRTVFEGARRRRDNNAFKTGRAKTPFHAEPVELLVLLPPFHILRSTSPVPHPTLSVPRPTFPVPRPLLPIPDTVSTPPDMARRGADRTALSDTVLHPAHAVPFVARCLRLNSLVRTLR